MQGGYAERLPVRCREENLTPFHEQRGRIWIECGERRIGEEMLVAGIEEQLGVGVELAARGRREGPLRRTRRARSRGFEQEPPQARSHRTRLQGKQAKIRSAPASTWRLREPLSDRDPERRTGVDEIRSHLVDQGHPALLEASNPTSFAKANPSSMESKVRPSNRSGVYTVWPALRSSSAVLARPRSSPGCGGRAVRWPC